MRHIDSELRRLTEAILSDIPSLMFEIRSCVKSVDTIDGFPSLINSDFQISDSDPLAGAMTAARKDLLIELGMAFVAAMRETSEQIEMLAMNRDLLCQARIELAKASGSSLIPVVDGKRGTSLHDAALSAACKPLNELVVGISKRVVNFEDELHFWEKIHEATIADEPDQEAIAALIERTFDEFHSWVCLGTNGRKSDESEHELALQLNFERVQAVQLANVSSHFVWSQQPRDHLHSADSESETADSGEAPKARASVHWSEPMCLADAGRKIWPSLSKSKNDSKNAARRVQKAMDEGWLRFERMGTSDYYRFDTDRFQK